VRTRWMMSFVTIGALAGLGIVESVRADQLGLLGLLCLIEVVVIAVAWSLRRTAPMAVRADLATWLETTAAITGESPDQIADRAVSSYRAAVHGDHGS